MKSYSTRQTAKQLGLHYTSLHRYITARKIPLPPVTRVGGVKVRLWTDADIERVRQLLPKIANGRKTRYKKQSAKTKTPPRAAVPHKKGQTKKKKKDR